MGMDRRWQILWDELVARVDSFYALPDEWSTKMAELGANQAALNAAVAELNVALGNIETEVEGLKAQVGTGVAAEDIDFSALDAAVARLEFTTTVDEDAVVEPPVEPEV